LQRLGWQGRGLLLAPAPDGAVRAKSSFEYSPLIGIWMSGAVPTALKTGPSRIGCQFTARPCRAATASISSAPM